MQRNQENNRSKATPESDSVAMQKSPKRSGRFLYRLLVVVTYVFTALCLLLIALAVGAFVVYQHVTRPGVDGRSVTLTVPEGASGQEIAELLEQQGLLEHNRLFRLAIRLDGEQQPIRHGIYEISKGHSATQILHQLYEGPDYHLYSNQIRITVPEGLNLEQMAELFNDPEAFLEAASNPEYIRELGLGTDSLEGFLMPDTYFFDEIPSEAVVVERMFEHFMQVKDELEPMLPEDSALDFLEVVTIASLVEREARVVEERPLIAAVILNRLDQDMPLQMDSTLQYALNKYGQRMLEADKEVDSPYNTYRYRGLPPGPIANPSRSSLEAVLNPAEVDYLYFVSNADGETHTFSTDYNDHLRAVQRYRQEIAIQRRNNDGN